MNYYFDMDGVLANFHKVPYSYHNAISYDFLANLDPFMDMINIVKKLIAAGNEIFISSLAASEEAKAGKFEWLSKYLPEISVDHVIIMVGNAKKHEHMMTEDGILVDDKKGNCRAWEKAGHKAIWVETRGQFPVEL